MGSKKFFIQIYFYISRIFFNGSISIRSLVGSLGYGVKITFVMHYVIFSDKV